MTMLWQRIAQNRLLDVGAVGIAVLVIVVLALRLPDRTNKIDFAHYYASSRLLLDGQNPYTTPLAATYARYGFVMEAEKDIPRGTNPPPLLWLFAPFAMLSPGAAYVAWQCLQLASLAAILGLIWHLLRNRISARGWLFVCAATLSCVPMYWHFYYAQVQLLLAAATLAAFALNRAGRQTAACLIMTAAGMVKLFPLVLVPWFVIRAADNNLTRLKRLLLCAALATAVFAATNPRLWADFSHHGLGLVTDWAVNRTTNFSVPSLIANFGFAAYDFVPSANVGRWWWTLGTSVGLLIIAAGYGRILCAKFNAEAEFCLLNVAMLLGGVTTWPHYFVFLIFPMVVVAARIAATPSAFRIISFVLLMFVLNDLGSKTGPILDRHMHLKILCNYIPTLGLVALGVVFLNELRPPGRVHARR